MNYLQNSISIKTSKNILIYLITNNYKRISTNSKRLIMYTENQQLFAPVLVVEDEEDHSRLIIKALNQAGQIMNSIILVENGQDAIDFLRKEGAYKDSDHLMPFLILLDVKMPMKSGFEVLEEIRGDENLKNIPVVMLTTSARSEDIEKAISLGANDYIVKPVKFEDFTDKVNKLDYYWGLISDVKKIFN